MGANAHRLLIIDDEQDIRVSLRGILEDEGHTVFEAASAEEGLAFLANESVHLVFLDIWMPQMDGLALLDILHATYPFLPVLMISGHGTIETAVNAIKKGAHDFIEKPLSLEKVLLCVERALEFSALKQENIKLKELLESPSTPGPMGASPCMAELRSQIQRVAPLDTSVLITGENGTGKEIVARALHFASKRSHMPFIALNCAAIPEELIESELFGHEKGAFTSADAAKAGKFEMAHQGTLFLDEIGDMSLKTQAKILRILQEKTFERVGGNRVLHSDVRIIAATNKDLPAAIAAGVFREDLYYRLRVFPLHVPPLRERGKDILLLVEYLTATLAQELGLASILFAEDAKEELLRYAWPGNVRELKNFIERMLILYAGSVITKKQLPPELLHNPKNVAQAAMHSAEGSVKLIGMPADFKQAKNVFEAQFLATKLQEFDGNISRLAEAIGLERSYLHRKLKAYNIQGQSE